MTDPTVLETVAETVPAVTEVIEVMETTDTEYLAMLVEYANWQTAFLLFFVVVILCYFAYKFFRIFF